MIRYHPVLNYEDVKVEIRKDVCKVYLITRKYHKLVTVECSDEIHMLNILQKIQDQTRHVDVNVDRDGYVEFLSGDIDLISDDEILISGTAIISMRNLKKLIEEDYAN